jgi:hypothetical protein
MINGEDTAYQSYLLRLWLVQCEGSWQWHASLRSPVTGEFQAFPDLETLLAHLRERCESLAPRSTGRAQATAGTGGDIREPDHQSERI